ncbi:NAD(P)/FAD-dependent oxidoreductase [Paraburkholderia sp. LEh10]|uniref:NAD(P)/FAD-dependent oxidoreductase n=1 Tax=Paraburkholderia sp. LEh10 TaxID=2821353 RepID=UPI001AE30087|nr:NAD(P)/FAD-dependent oxidoreductase [Paraburkholderia sp. LEh10]MBP0591587.1 NAD(P)/FAD-dependent oxidoreductase [Paraburkholderia sp. LEh10]
MNQSVDVLVIGAGPGGLTAGYLLTKNTDLSVTMIEKDPTYVGGISRTERFEGHHFDIGGHRFFSKSAEVVALWHELLPDDFIERPRSSRIFYRNKFYRYPLDGIEALRNLGLIESAHCVLSYLAARIRPCRDPNTFHQWVANQFGERLFSIFFKTYTEKVWGMSCDEISADWAAQRIKGLSLSTAIVNATKRSLGIRSRKNSVKTLIESFHYPRRGPGMLWEAAARKFQNQGGRLLMGHAARTLAYDENSKHWTVEAVGTDGQTTQIIARHVICTAPMRETMNAISPMPRSAAAAAKLQYRDFITVALILDRPATFSDNWIYIHDPSVKVGRIQNFASWSPEMVPDTATGGCLGLEYFCFDGDSLWESSDAELTELAIGEVEKIGLATRDQVRGSRVVRQPKAYPVYDDLYRAIVDEVRADLADHYPNLHLVGRNGMHKYNNQDHAMMTAMLTVENIVAGTRLRDTWAVNEDAEYHESGDSPEVSEAGVSGLRAVPSRAMA